MRRVYAIQLSDFFPSAVLPQAIGTLWSYANTEPKIQQNYKLCRTYWENESAEDVIQDIQDPDLIICSCYVWNWQRTYQIIQAIKRKHPRCIIILGGPEPTYSIKWVSEHPEVDILIPYYGEVILRSVLLENLSVANFEKLPGVITANVYNKESIKPNLDDIPSPYLNGFFDSLIQKHKSQYVRAVFESNRGCPYSCTFCDIGSKEYQKVNCFDFERCIKEIEWMMKNNIVAIDVADANFGLFPIDEEIAEHVVQLKNRYNWNGRFLPTWSKSKGDRTLRIAKKLINNKLDSIFGLSLQSLNEQTLKNINRRNAFNLPELGNIVSMMNEDGISTYTELIFPLPGDTLDNFRDGIYKVLDMKDVFTKFQINQLSHYANAEISVNKEDFSIEWRKIIGFTRHYYGDRSEDTIAVANDLVTKEETFESLFFVKCYIIPFYFYGLARELSDELHRSDIKKRSLFFEELYNHLHEEKWFQDFKKQQYLHYFGAINGENHFGQVLISDPNEFYPEFAVSHQFYLQNKIHDKLISWYPEYSDLIQFDKSSFWDNENQITKLTFTQYKKGTWIFSDERVMGYDDYIREIYTSGRFDQRWKKQTIKIED